MEYYVNGKNEILEVERTEEDFDEGFFVVEQETKEHWYATEEDLFDSLEAAQEAVKNQTPKNNKNGNVFDAIEENFRQSAWRTFYNGRFSW